MAGVQAGRLEIEIVAEIARLQQDLDKAKRAVNAASGEIARSAKAANDNLAGIGRGAGAGVAEFSREVARLKSNIDPAWGALQKYKQEVALLQQALREGAITHAQYVAQMRTAVANYKGAGDAVTGATNAQRAGMQQLGYQLGDISTMYAMGAKPVQIFASQIGQVTQAVQMMSGGTSKFAAFLGGPWGIAISVAVMALGPLIAKLFETKDAADSARGALEALRKTRIADAQEQRVLTDLQSDYNKNLQRQSELEREIATRSGGRKNGDGSPMFAYKQQQELNALRKESAALSEDMSFKVRQLAGTVQDYTKTEEKSVKAVKQKKAALTDAEKAYKSAFNAANNFIEALQQEVARIGKNAKEIRAIEVARAKDAAATIAQKNAIQQLADERERLLKIEEDAAAVKSAQDENKAVGDRIREAREALELLKLTGVERERYASILAIENEIRLIGIKITEAEKAGNAELITQLQARIALLYELMGIQGQGFDRQRADEVAKETEKLAEESRRRALDAAYQIADIIGGRIGRVMNELAGTLDRAQGIFKTGSEFEKILAGAGIGGIAGSATGSGLGGSIGGAIGGKLGEKFLKGLGDFAGPIGSIVGGLLGGVIGGMVKSTPRASATVSIIAGEAMETAVKGSSGKLKAIAGGMADSLINGLAEIADALGAEMTGNAQVSVGMRNGKYRVDTTGSGITKTSKGAVDFGKDGEAAAIAFAIQDAIKDGVLGGLSESLNKLITADGDIQTNLSKALSFKGVFDELWERTDPLGFALDKLSREQAALTKIFDQAGATVEEYAKLEELFTLKRADAVKENTAQAEAEEKAADIARQRREMEITLMELQGKSAEALAASRALELEALDASLRPLQEQIYAEQDLAKETAAAAEAQRVYAANLAASTAIARGVYADRRKMDIEVMELTGNAAGALAAQRTLELEAMHPANRALQEYIWTLQDAAKEAAKAAEIAKTKRGLEIQLQEAMGNSAAAIQMQRDDILAGLDPSLRALQQQVWAEQDLAEARKAAADAAKETTDAEKDRLAGMYEALNALRSAHTEQVDALNKTADAWMDTARKLIAFRDGVLLGAANDNGMAGSRAAFMRAKVSGDTDAFISAGSAYLDSARAGAGSYGQYQDAIAEVVGSSNGMISGAYGQAGSAYAEVAKLNAQFAEMSAAIIASYEGQTEEVLPMFAATVSASMETVAHQIEASGQKAAQAQATAQTALEAVAIAVNRMERVISSWDGGGAARVMTDDDTPLVTVAA